MIRATRGNAWSRDLCSREGVAEAAAVGGVERRRGRGREAGCASGEEERAAGVLFFAELADHDVREAVAVDVGRDDRRAERAEVVVGREDGRRRIRFKPG